MPGRLGLKAAVQRTSGLVRIDSVNPGLDPDTPGSFSSPDYPPVIPDRCSAMAIARSRMSTARSMASFSITNDGISWNRL
jgi:hypothetical protein